MATQGIRIEPEPTIGDLIGRLTDDSKRLANNEVRLARLEMGESIHHAVQGGIRFALAFGIAILALVALSVLLTAVIGTVLIGKAWAGALITGALEMIVGALLLWAGMNVMKKADFTLGESRAELKTTVNRLSDTASRVRVRME
ncbi:MAG TPA: phage holin family protein [Gemmatimonadaceae bacterium]